MEAIDRLHSQRRESLTEVVENPLPDDSNTLAGQMREVRLALIELGNALIAEGWKLIEWVKANR